MALTDEFEKAHADREARQAKAAQQQHAHQQQQQYAQQPQQPQHGGQPQQPEQKLWSFHNNNFMQPPIGRGVGSEYTTKMLKSLSEIFATANADMETVLVSLDNTNDTSLVYSAIAVAIRRKSRPELGVAFHLLLLEATGDRLLPVTETINREQVEIYRPASDALNQILANKATEKVRAAFPDAKRVCMVDGISVPTSFDPDNKHAVHRLAFTAGLACTTELEVIRPDFQDFNLALHAKDSSLLVDIRTGRDDREDEVGLPVRRDVVLSFVSQKAGQAGHRPVLNDGDRASKISELGGFIDVMWSPSSPIPQMTAYGQPPAPTQDYLARYVITDFTADFSNSPAAVLLALSTALTLVKDNNWIQAFQPRVVPSGEIDLHDIGALNIEANLAREPGEYGTRMATKSDVFKLTNLYEYIFGLIRPGICISMDVPQAGPQTWFLSVFALAALGDQGAYNTIYNGAMSLTNGHFEKYFAHGSPMFDPEIETVHLGYWPDRSGTNKDIRHIDYVAVMNLIGERDPSMIRDWSDTFTRKDYPQAQRLAARKNMIMGFTHEKAIFTDKARRLTLKNDLLQALANGEADAGLTTRITTPLSMSDFNNRRGVAGYADTSLITAAPRFVSADAGYSAGYAPQGFGYRGRY